MCKSVSKVYETTYPHSMVKTIQSAKHIDLSNCTLYVRNILSVKTHRVNVHDQVSRMILNAIQNKPCSLLYSPACSVTQFEKKNLHICIKKTHYFV